MPDDPRTATPPSSAPPPAPAPRHPIRSVLVVGGGLAGTQTVAALRGDGFDGRITVVGREPIPPYDRPPLSKHLLDRTEPAWLTEELGVDVRKLADDVRLGAAASRLVVEPRGATVTVDGSDLRADAVVIATGSRAVRPAGWESAVTLHTADDAARLRARLGRGRRLVVVGAGWVGAEVAGVAAAAGVHVTVVEATTAPLATALGARVGDLTVPWYEAAGVRLELGVGVSAVSDAGVQLADGRHLAADVVLAAVGARPDTAWLADALPRDPDGSLRVDVGHAVLGVPGHVRAVGDVARRWSPRHGWVAGGHWDGALRGPAVAVRALLSGGDAGPDRWGDPSHPADPAPYVFSTQLGHDLTLYGQQQPGDELVLRGDPGGSGGWAALWFAAPKVDVEIGVEVGAEVGGTAGSAGARAEVGTAAGSAAHGTAGGSGRRAGGSASGAGRELTAVLAVDRPRDVAAARRLFTGERLPRLDPEVASDAGRGLRDAVVG